MKYLCLIYESQSRYLTMAKADAEKVTGEYFALNDELQEQGAYVAGAPLQPPWWEPPRHHSTR